MTLFLAMTKVYKGQKEAPDIASKPRYLGGSKPCPLGFSPHFGVDCQLSLNPRKANYIQPPNTGHRRNAVRSLGWKGAKELGVSKLAFEWGAKGPPSSLSVAQSESTGSDLWVFQFWFPFLVAPFSVITFYFWVLWASEV